MFVFLCVAGVYILLGFPQLLAASKIWKDLGAFILTFLAKPSENPQTKKHLLYPPGRGFRKHSSILILNHQCSLKDEIGQGWTDSFRVSPWWLWWMFDSLYCGGYSTDVFFSWLFQGKWSNFRNIFLSNSSKPSTRPHDSIWCDMIPTLFQILVRWSRKKHHAALIVTSEKTSPGETFRSFYW